MQINATVFGGHFNQKSLARTQTWDRQFAQISVLSSGDQRAILHVIEIDEPRDSGKPTPSLVTFVSRHQQAEKSRILFVQPAMLKNRVILCFEQRIEVLCRLGEAHHWRLSLAVWRHFTCYIFFCLYLLLCTVSDK